jgi:hypothetical protein
MVFLVPALRTALDELEDLSEVVRRHDIQAPFRRAALQRDLCR